MVPARGVEDAMTVTTELGPAYTAGDSYRARAEARQRAYRAAKLAVGYEKYGHMLTPAAAAKGSNFVIAEAFDAAVQRDAAGKGVGSRTFGNMLSSQAMCFNIFAPLADRPEMAAAILRTLMPDLDSVESISIEYTPEPEALGDQSKHGGVDCDVLIEATMSDGERLVWVIETKFVEPGLVRVGFASRVARPKDCPFAPRTSRSETTARRACTNRDGATCIGRGPTSSACYVAIRGSAAVRSGAHCGNRG